MPCPHLHDFMRFARAASELCATYNIDPKHVRLQLACGCTADTPAPPPAAKAPATSSRGSICPECGSSYILPSGSCERCGECGSSIGGCS